eukprot:m.220988 g.220988  ORF g.220988 m.220988 type:complete len:60 (+) comp39951_c2_seq40:1469-1648(+)
MLAERLQGLALMKINREICEKIERSREEMDKLVRRFVQMQPRRMKMPFSYKTKISANNK